MSRSPSKPSDPPSGRAVNAVGRFIDFVNLLDQGKLRQAAREQSELRRLGFNVEVRALHSPSQTAEEQPS